MSPLWRGLALWCLAALWFACTPPSASDAGAGSGADAGTGASDAGRPPLELSFVPVSLPQIPTRLGLASDGVTLLAISTIGSAASGTLQSAVVASQDQGSTWAVRSVSNANLLQPDLDGGVYALTSQALLRSLDGAQTFTLLTLPPEVPTSPPPQLTVTADDALWVTSRAANPAVVRSVDHGATFTVVPVPTGTTRLQPCASSTTAWFGVRDGAEVVSSDGTTWTSHGASGAMGPVSCIVTPAGTLLLTIGTPTGFEALRLEAGASSFQRQPADGFFRYAVRPGVVARALTTGRLDESIDDGLTWVPRAGDLAPGQTLSELVSVGTTWASLVGGLARLSLGASAWELVLDPGFAPGTQPIELAFARDSPAAAMLVNDNVQRTVYVAIDGFTWARGRTLPQGAATALALSPDGEQVFLGASDGTYRVLADAGRDLVIDSRIETAAGLNDRNPIRQAVWDRAGGSLILVTTANDADTQGSVWQLNPDTGARDWVERRPFSTTSAPAVRRGGYHALALSSAGPGALTRSMVVGLRSNVTTNSFLNYLLTWQPVFDSSGWWLQDEPPVGFSAPRSASCNGAWGGGLAVAWPPSQLWVGQFANSLRQVPLPQNVGEIFVVRFSNDGHLWLVTSAGLWRTTTPVRL